MVPVRMASSPQRTLASMAASRAGLVVAAWNPWQVRHPHPARSCPGPGSWQAGQLATGRLDLPSTNTGQPWRMYPSAAASMVSPAGAFSCSWPSGRGWS
jgi:hypothetical protein